MPKDILSNAVTCLTDPERPSDGLPEWWFRPEDSDSEQAEILEAESRFPDLDCHEILAAAGALLTSYSLRKGRR